MGEWQDISTAPKSGWIEAKYNSGGVVVVIAAAEEYGWWEDETGDWIVEARYHPNGFYGLTHWRYLRPGYLVSNYEGSDRYAEPVATPSEAYGPGEKP